MECKKCATEMKKGKALAQTWKPGLSDFPGDSVGITLSPGGPGKMIDVLKCPACGYSVAA